MKKTTVLIAVIFCLTQGFAQQQIDTISFEHLKLDKLQLGTSVYHVYTGKKMDSLKLVAILSKSVERDPIKSDQLLFHHEMRRPGSEERSTFIYRSTSTLFPINHIRNNNGNVEGFLFAEDEITGIDTISKNRDFKIKMLKMPFNWEIDTETYGLLPMKWDKTFVLYCYHPGSKEPRYITIQVLGKEKVKMENGKQVECWKLFTDYGGEQPSSFYYTVGEQKFIKMEANYGDLKILQRRV